MKNVLSRTLGELGIESTNVRSSEAMSYILWLVSLQSSRPVKKIFFPWNGLPVEPSEVLYHSRRVFYKIRDRNKEASMLNLETGKTSIWTNRTPIMVFTPSGRDLFIVSENGYLEEHDFLSLCRLTLVLSGLQQRGIYTHRK